MDEGLRRAAQLAHWLITQKGVDTKKAYIIAQRKYKVPTWQIVCKARQLLKPVQEELL